MKFKARQRKTARTRFKRGAASRQHRTGAGNGSEIRSMGLGTAQAIAFDTPADSHDRKSIEDVIKASDRRQTANKNRPQKRRYYDQTRRPIVCLAFVLPLLIFYEGGSLLMNGQSTRSGIDQWIHQALQQIGFGQLMLLPLIAIGVMVIWHHRERDHWRIRFSDLGGMLAETFGLGVILFCAASAISMLVSGPISQAENAVSSSQWWSGVVGMVGSGIYEELVFRIVLLVPAIYWAGKMLSNQNMAIGISVLAISLLFAALHYNSFNPAGDPMELSSFVFRFLASVVFCLLFLFRGFGIAVGTHVAYDVLTQI